MKIDLGNFGYQQREASSAQVDRGDPTVMAKAMQGVAQTNLEQASRANQAWAQTGKSMQQLGQNVLEVVSERAKLEAANNLQKADADFDNEYQRLSASAVKGEIRSDDIVPAFQKFRDNYKLPEVAGLGPMSSTRYQQGFAQTGDKMHPRFANLAAETHRTETKIALDTNAEQHITNAIREGRSPEETLAYFDQPGFDAANREANGASAGQYKHAYQQKALSAYIDVAINAAKDSNGALDQVNAMLTNPNSIFSMMDVEHRVSHENQIGSYKNHNTSVAAAAQAHADALARQAEANAQTLYNRLDERQRRGEIIPPAELAQAATIINHTNFGQLSGGVASIQYSQMRTQEARNLQPDILDTKILDLNNKLDTVGGTEAEYKTRDAYVKFRNERETLLREDGVAFIDHETRQTTPNLRFDDVRRNQDSLVALGTELNRRTQLLKDGQGYYGDRLTVAPIRTTELQNFQGLWDKASAPERVGLLADIRSVTSPETYQAFTNQLKDVDPGFATLAATAHTKDGINIAKDYATGQDMLKKGTVKPPKDEDLLGIIDKHFGSTYTPSQKLDVMRTIKPIVTARGMTEDSIDSDVITDVLSQTEGTRTKVTTQGMWGAGSTNVAYAITPPGKDPAVFKREFNEQLDTLGPDMAQNVRNHLDDGTWKVVYDPQGNIRISDGERWQALGNRTNYLTVTK